MKKNFLLAGTFLLVAGFLGVNAEVIYVTETGGGDGSSWSNAATLEDAFSWAGNGDEIFVKKGTYTGSFKLRAEATVYGNCEGTETEAPVYTTDEGLETFLKGPGDKRVLYLDGKASVLYGLDISEGDASTEATGVGRGGGVYINNGGATLKYCNIHDNVGVDGSKALLGSNGKPQKGVGGGLYILNGRLENCIIENNVATTSPWEDNSHVWATGIGGGICLDATEGNGCNPDKAVVLNCIIRNNSTTSADDEDSFASQGGGIAIKSGKLINSLVINNSVNGSLNNQSVGGGVAQAVVNAIKKMDPDREVKVASAQGLAECKKLLMMAKAGKYNGYLLEGMGCPGGCIGGAGTIADPVRTAAQLNKYVAAAPFKDPEDSAFITNIHLLKDDPYFAR